MQPNDNILKLLIEKDAEAARRARRGVILQPGAIGDCVLTLPLAEFMKESLQLGGVDILGHTEYTGIFPGRTCVDGVFSIDSIELHRLFAETKTFELADRDPLINTFAEYAWIVSFLGEPNSNFEQNLIFTANCSHSAEVVTLSMKPPKKFSTHITEFYIRQFARQSGLISAAGKVQQSKTLIRTTQSDITKGKELLTEAKVNISRKLVVVQPGSGGVHKCWHMDNFVSLAKELDRKGIEVLFLLGPAEADRFNRSSLNKISSAAKSLTNVPLADVLGLLSCTDIYLGNDCGITQLAGALGVKTIAVFGPTDPNVYMPVGPAVTAFRNNTKTFSKKPSTALQQRLLKILTA